MNRQAETLRVVVLGYLVRGPLGGLAWHHLQYVLGLASMGHDVLFLETNEDDSVGCYDPSRDQVGSDPTYGKRFAAASFDMIGLRDAWAYRHTLDEGWLGPAASRVESFCRTADVVINVSGVTALAEPYDAIPVRVLVDTDPVFQQVRVLTEPSHAEYVGRHTSWFTFGMAIGSVEARIPADGFAWKPTRQPVHLDAWTPSPVPVDRPLTTVMQWDSYERRTWDGVTYGMKAESFDPYLSLPHQVAVTLEIALGGPGAPPAELSEHGWRLENPLVVTRTPGTYRDYLSASLGEFSVAKHGYVISHSGWFSERSANYLASGRPVIAQDTGFSNFIECGEGLLTFNTPAEAVAAIETVAADPQRHGRRAREVAEAHLDARVVLQRLLDACS